MKKTLSVVATVISLAVAPAFAQMGGGGGGPHFDGAIDKLFGANQSYTAMLEIQTTGDSGTDVSMPGKINFDTGKSRFELNIGDVKGSQMSPALAQQLKSMGMDVVISISRPDLKLAYLVYPGLNSYAEMSSQATSASLNPSDFKVETEQLGKETLNGHDCVKNKATITDKDGTNHVYTVWNATDLKNFPVQIVTTEEGHPVTMVYKDVIFTKPAASLFEPPAGLTKYNDPKTMMQTEMMKKMSSAAGQPPAQPPGQ